MGRFLITGAAGFIGSHLAETLLAQGHAVRGLDNFATGTADNLPDAPGIEMIRGDIRDPAALTSAMAGCDGVFHLAAIASVQACAQNWADSSTVNLTGSLHVFETAARAGLPVVYASSAAVYGNPDPALLPLAETTPTAPISGYGADKLACELHAAAMAHTHGLRAVGLRFFNVYGPRQQRGSAYSGVITIFLDRWQAGQGLTIFGDGRQTRDFIYAGDVARALAMAMQAAAGGQGGVYNICTGNTISVAGLAQKLSQVTGDALPVAHEPARAGDIAASQGDPAAAKAALGFTAGTGFADGLAATAAWAAGQGG